MGVAEKPLSQRLCFLPLGAIDRLGKVDDGTTTSDYDPDEIKRKISINASLAPCEWKNVKINLIDAPGYADFVGDVKGALRVSDAVLIVVCAVSGIEVGVETSWDFAEEYGVPRAFFINKMERENADFYAVYEALKVRYGSRVVPVNIPIGSQDTFKGVVDLISLKAITGAGNQATVGEFPTIWLMPLQNIARLW